MRSPWTHPWGLDSASLPQTPQEEQSCFSVYYLILLNLFMSLANSIDFVV